MKTTIKFIECDFNKFLNQKKFYRLVLHLENYLLRFCLGGL